MAVAAAVVTGGAMVAEAGAAPGVYVLVILLIPAVDIDEPDPLRPAVLAPLV